ncbi:MAG: hypothetical protein RDV41_00170 [Planctomycetota bacterium]|nr:hypothetical protein [Planctomycetota bacterium]
MTDFDLRDMAEKFKATAKENLQTHGVVLPIAFLFDTSGRVNPVMLNMKDSSEKEACSRFLRETVKQLDVIAYLIVAEAFVADRSMFLFSEKIPPSEHPEHVDAIFVQARSRDECLLWIIKFRKTDTGIVFAKEELYEEDTKGLFGNLFEEENTA